MIPVRTGDARVKRILQNLANSRDILLVLVLVAAFCLPFPVSAAAPRPVNLRCEQRTNPLGVDVPRPSFGWELKSPNYDVRQTAYQVLVATAPARLKEGAADLWDSGLVRSRESVEVAYGGLSLGPRQSCYWKVRIRDGTGGISRWSDVAVFELGLLRADHWLARWIGRGPGQDPRPAADWFGGSESAALRQSVTHDGRSILLRTTFLVRPGLRHARAYVTGLGYHEFTCNGRKVGRQVLAPAVTNYRRWVLYDVHDLAPLLRTGLNALGLHLGNGWYNPYPAWWEIYRMPWYGSPRAILQLHLEYADGTEQVVVTDDTWQTAPGPVLNACVYNGETYDATQEIPGWDTAAFDASQWDRAQIVAPPGGELLAQPMPAIEITRRLKPIAVTEPKPGGRVYDLGQNIAGGARLEVQGRRGTRLQLRHAEDLGPDGMLDTRSNEKAAATDTFILRGNGVEICEPRFTFHGFRYLEVTGSPELPRILGVEGCEVRTACAQTGTFACDDDLLNRLHAATVASQRSAMIGYPLDCPQRDERLGWLGDAMVSAEETLFNFDSGLFLRHWLEGIRRNQNPANGDISIVSPRPYTPAEPDPAWSSAALVTAWDYYTHRGDHRFLAEHYDGMKRYVEYLGTRGTNHILPRYWIGDWGSVVEGWQEGDPPSVGTAFYYWDALILARAARVLGHDRDAVHYQQLAESIREAYNRTFFNPARRRYEPGSQFSNAFSLVLGLVEESERAVVLEEILADIRRREGHLSVGVLGAKHLLDALSLAGRSDTALAVIRQPGYPGWANLIQGRTTLSEFWNLRGSHNHVMLGSVDAWLYRTLGGIQPDPKRPGYEHVVIAPFIPNDLTRVNATVQTPRGLLAVQWHRGAQGLRLRVEIPGNTEATVIVPLSGNGPVRCQPERLPVVSERLAARFELGSGVYDFSMALSTGGPRPFHAQ
jgi:alpha-L-rhamnosidase